MSCCSGGRACNLCHRAPDVAEAESAAPSRAGHEGYSGATAVTQATPAVSGGQPAEAGGGLRLVRGVAHRFSWGLADQAVSSLSNAAVSLYIARQLGAAEFGAFSVAYVTYSFVLNASRGLGTDPLLVRFSHVEHPVWRRAVRCCTTTATLVGLLMGVVCLIIGATGSGTTQLAFIALGIALPGLTLQDSWRYAFFALGKGSKAFINDVIWAVTLVGALLVLRFTHHETVFWFMLAWGATANLAALCGLLQARLIPRWDGASSWLKETRDLGTRYLIENTGNSSSNQIRLYAVGGILGLASVGYIQEGLLMMGPFFVIFQGVSLVTVPEAARSLRRSVRALWKYCMLVAAVLTTGALLWGVILMVALPHGLGSLLLRGDNWQAAYSLVPWLVLSMMGATMTAGANAGLRALGAARLSMRVTLIQAAAYIVLGVIGAVLWGTHGSVAGSAIATWFGATLCWWQLRAALRQHSESLEQQGTASSTVRALGPALGRGSRSAGK
jgi:O-antigen/teichoic acid export membrane protein